MLKLMLSLLGVLAAVTLVVTVTVWSWTRTPHGRLTVPAAVLSRISAWQGDGEDAGSFAAMRLERRKSIELVIGTPTPVAAVRNEQIPGAAGSIAVRIYNPSQEGTLLPVIVYYHGGGWVLGDLDSHDNVCRALAAGAQAVVVSVDYRLAPENPWPAAVDDAWAALEWVAANAATIGADAARIAVAGDSAGGNLAAVVALMARERGGPALRAQALFYPGVDLVTSDRPSLIDFADGPFLSSKRIEWFKDLYVPDRATRRDPHVSPLLAADHRGLPPTIVITAEFDPLRDEGEAYGEALRAAGVPVSIERYDGVIHGFVSMDRWFPEAGQALALASAWLREHELR